VIDERPLPTFAHLKTAAREPSLLAEMDR